MKELCDAFDSLPQQSANTLYVHALLLATSSLTSDPSAPEQENRLRRERDAVRAVDALGRSLAAGLKDTKLLKNLASLAPFRARQDVEALLAGATLLEKRQGSSAHSLLDPVDPAGRRASVKSADDDLDRYRADLASSQHAIGLVQLGLDDPLEALKSLEQVVDLRETLVKKHPQSSLHLIALSKAWFAKGAALGRLGNAAAAGPARKAALEVAESLTKAHSSDPGTLSELVDLYVSEGAEEWKDGRLADAVALRDRGRALLEDRLRLAPQDTKTRNRLAQLELAVSEEFSQLGLWREATPHAIRASDLGVDMVATHWFGVAAAMWMGGDEAACLRHLDKMRQRFASLTGSELADLLRTATFASSPENFERRSETSLRGLYEQDAHPPGWALNYRIATANRLGESAAALELARSVHDAQGVYVLPDVATAEFCRRRSRTSRKVPPSCRCPFRQDSVPSLRRWTAKSLSR